MFFPLLVALFCTSTQALDLPTLRAKLLDAFKANGEHSTVVSNENQVATIYGAKGAEAIGRISEQMGKTCETGKKEVLSRAFTDLGSVSKKVACWGCACLVTTAALGVAPKNVAVGTLVFSLVSLLAHLPGLAAAEKKLALLSFDEVNTLEDFFKRTVEALGRQNPQEGFLWKFPSGLLGSTGPENLELRFLWAPLEAEWGVPMLLFLQYGQLDANLQP